MSSMSARNSREAMEGLTEKVVGDPDVLDCLRRDSGVPAWHERVAVNSDLVLVPPEEDVGGELETPRKCQVNGPNDFKKLMKSSVQERHCTYHHDNTKLAIAAW